MPETPTNPASRRPDREETSLLAVHVPKSLHRALRLLAAAKGITLTALHLELYARYLSAEGVPLLQEHERQLDDCKKYGRRRRRRLIGDSAAIAGEP